MGIWSLIAGYQILTVFREKSTRNVNNFLLDATPTVFTTLGVLGTFLGIFSGLENFDVDNITDSIPDLLEGLKTAFLTSIVGIIAAMVSGRILDWVLQIAQKNEGTVPTGELGALIEIRDLLQGIMTNSATETDSLRAAIQGNSDKSILSQIQLLEEQNTELKTVMVRSEQLMKSTVSALSGKDENSLLVQLQQIRAENTDAAEKSQESVRGLQEVVVENRSFLDQKFTEFSDLLSKNNTEALVEVMKSATEQFNAQMSALIEKLVQENFKELNKSVLQMNSWQQENKEMISSLTQQFQQVSKDFALSAESIESITDQTRELTEKDGALAQMIEELRRIMVDDQKFEEIINKVNSTVETLKSNTEAFDETTNKLNLWVRNQRSFSDSVDRLLIKLEDVERIKDISEDFWQNTKKQLNEGVGFISQASTYLAQDLENINAEFYERLNSTLTNMDTLIQRIIANYKK